MKQAKVHYSIDWLQATTPDVKGAQQMIFDRAQRMFPEAAWSEAGRAQRPYTNVTASKYAEIHWHPEHPEFKYMLRMSGQQLDTFRRDGGDERRLLNLMQQYHFDITRIDLARDIFAVAARPASLYNKWRMQELRTTAKIVTLIQSTSKEGNTEGETVYFGSRHSQRFLRVYDKGRQTKTNGAWTRAEIELKRDNAQVAAHQILNVGLQVHFQSLLHSIIISGLPQWMKDEGNIEIIAIEAVPRKLTNTEKWLFDVVVPAVYKALASDVPGFRDTLEKMLNDDAIRHGSSTA